MPQPKVGRGNGTPRKHGLTGTRTYNTWINMRQRCQNPNNDRYADWGGRGIRVCDRWSSFENFLTDMGEAPAGMSIERIDNDGDYEPGNCRWATRAEQSRNTRRSRMVMHEGETMGVSDWSKRLGVSRACLRRRLKKSGTIRPM